MNERIEQISMDWFLMEPALFKVLCSHQVEANAKMQCPLRCGKRRIEYNPSMCCTMTDEELTERFKTECIRILLKHPYERQPDNCSPQAITMGSNCVVSDNYRFRSIRLESPQDFDLEPGMPFEYYAKHIPSPPPASSSEDAKDESDSEDDNQSSNDSDKGNSDSVDKDTNSQSLADSSELWQEDPMSAAEVNEMIKVMAASDNWGSLAGNLVGKIIASTKVKIDYRKVMQSFRADMLSSKRRLTRMRPNRRSGFENFGSVYKLTSRLLVAIDVSGSTTDEMVSKFFGVVNKFFKYGIEEIDVIQFDAEIKGEPETLKKARKDGIDIVGRGGTDFQPVIDFAHSQRGYYHGLIILTDGYADKPHLPDFYNTPLLWVLPSEKEYMAHKDWMQKLGKACFIEI